MNKLDEDLDLWINCPICSNELCEPTTMSCGHSFCRVCTINWCFVYKNYNCPVCRRKLEDKTLPNVNLTLKYLIALVKEKNLDFGQIKVPFDHEQLVNKVAKSLGEPFEPSEEDSLIVAKPSDSTMARLNFAYFPIYLCLTVIGVVFLGFLRVFKLVLR